MKVNAILPAQKNLALVAHDHRKTDMVEWAKSQYAGLAKHKLCATRSTGTAIETATGLKIELFRSGPYGGDMELGSKIVQQEIHGLIFFWDPLSSLPHDPDVRALLRVATLWNIPIACNSSTADFMLSSPLMHQAYSRNLLAHLQL